MNLNWVHTFTDSNSWIFRIVYIQIIHSNFYFEKKIVTIFKHENDIHRSKTFVFIEHLSLCNKLLILILIKKQLI